MENEHEELEYYEKQILEGYEKQKADQKASSGGIPSIVFLISTAYLFIVGLGLKPVFSLKGLSFIFIGIFAAAFIIGPPFYLLQRGVTKATVRFISFPISSSTATMLNLLGLLITALQITVTVWLTSIAFHLLFK